MVEKITTTTKLRITCTNKFDFPQSAQAEWPDSRTVGAGDILIEKETEAYHPNLISRVDNMGLNSSIFSTTMVQSGNHPANLLRNAKP